MPTQKPRIAVTLTPETDAALRELAAAVKRPAATVAAELLSELTPIMEGVAKMARHVEAGNKSAAKRVLTHAVGREMAHLIVSMSQQDSATQNELFKSGTRSAQSSRASKSPK